MDQRIGPKILLLFDAISCREIRVSYDYMSEFDQGIAIIFKAAVWER